MSFKVLLVTLGGFWIVIYIVSNHRHLIVRNPLTGASRRNHHDETGSRSPTLPSYRHQSRSISGSWPFNEHWRKFGGLEVGLGWLKAETKAWNHFPEIYFVRPAIRMESSIFDRRKDRPSNGNQTTHSKRPSRQMTRAIHIKDPTSDRDEGQRSVVLECFYDIGALVAILGLLVSIVVLFVVAWRAPSVLFAVLGNGNGLGRAGAENLTPPAVIKRWFEDASSRPSIFRRSVAGSVSGRTSSVHLGDSLLIRPLV
jgi:hypothetical protein